MTQSTKDFLIRLGAVVIALLVLVIGALFTQAVFNGTAAVPETVQAQIWTALTGLIVVLSTATIAYINSRSIARTAAQVQATSNRNAQATQETVIAAAEGTQQKIDEVSHVVTNGLAGKTAAIVKEDAEKAARQAADAVRGSRRQQDMDQTAAAIAALGARLDAIMLHLSPAAPAAEPDKPAEPEEPDQEPTP